VRPTHDGRIARAFPRRQSGGQVQSGLVRRRSVTWVEVRDSRMIHPAAGHSFNGFHPDLCVVDQKTSERDVRRARGDEAASWSATSDRLPGATRRHRETRAPDRRRSHWRAYRLAQAWHGPATGGLGSPSPVLCRPVARPDPTHDRSSWEYRLRLFHVRLQPDGEIPALERLATRGSRRPTPDAEDSDHDRQTAARWISACPTTERAASIANNP
jgi:hypothetical protein